MTLDKLEVLNPVALTGLRNIDPAVRPTSLEGKRVGLYWNYKPGGNHALDRVGEEIMRRFKGVSVKLYPSGRPVPKSVLDAVKSECDVVVGSTAD